ncbi:MAG: capsular biosynthesis protein [Pseudomonadota bacterium]
MTLCPGDRLYWSTRHGPAVAYRGRPEGWSDFILQVMRDRRVTDLVCLGDGRRAHAEAIAAARAATPQVRVHVLEQGYLRPNLLTLEPDGTGGRSGVPEEFRRLGEIDLPLPDAPQSFRSSFLEYAAFDTLYHLSNVLTSWMLYPHYRSHALDPPLREWAGWIGKLLRRPARARGREEALAKVRAHEGPLFLLPLQLPTDYQIRDHGPAGGLRDALRTVIGSFEAHAPMDAYLLIKVHPLDNGWTPWRRWVEEATVTDRVTYLDGGDLDALLGRSAGVVTVNSTVGLTALERGVPVHVLGTAIYAHEGTTDPQPLESFWSAPTRPDRARVRRFIAFLRHTVQFPGSFDGEGAEPGADNLARAILAPPPF